MYDPLGNGQFGNTNWKVHAIAIGVIVSVITVVFLAFAPPPKKETAVTEEAKGSVPANQLHIEIVRATWGLNCNQIIDYAIDRIRKNPELRKKGNIPERVQPNNVRRIISDACAGKPACQFEATSEALKINPYHTCMKQLLIDYRCFSYDQLRTLKANERDKVVMDCRNQK